MRVSVIGTIHEPFGRATADALLALMRHLRPDVIFLEMPPGAFDDYMGGSRSNLEAEVVRRYRAERQVDLVPVDLPTPEPEFFAGWDELRREVRSKSVDYCRFKSWEEQYVEQLGFDFLNSSQGAKLTADLHEATLTALAQLANPRLSGHYEAFTSTNERRDVAMLQNIEAYCASSTQGNGVFLVGSAHRRSLFEKSVARSGAVSYPVVWDFPGTV
ncbi:MAG: hypothetical protein IT357_04020 [Gemmatimonadaceae bacterium]|nr:hypothetical protein [Gemmatimonadaceae bacterium]